MTIHEASLSFHGAMEPRATTTRLILHHAAASTCSVEDVHRWHLANGWCGIGYHFLVRKDGTVWRGRPEGTVGAHAYGANRDSVGVCFEGNFEHETMPDAQRQAGAALVTDLLARYGLTSAAVIRHSDVCATACPGKHFPFAALVSSEAAKDNRVLAFQQAALADGYAFPKYGADGLWGSECENVAARCVVKKRATYQNRHATALAQRLLGVEADGKCGKVTDAAIRAFQKARGLTIDGAVGVLTWRALLEVDDA